MLKKHSSKYLLKKVKHYSDNFNNRKAICNLDKLLSFDRDNLDALLLKGLSHAFLFEKDESLDCFNRALESDSNNLNIYL